MAHFNIPMPSNGTTNVPDDTNVQTQQASIQVDYLSHQWKESDVWATWRNMTRQKNDIANGVRLENASWRTWWKQRNHLKTVSPQTLNWLKDSDVTWLYGPLFGDPEPVPAPKVASTADKLNIIDHLPKGKKPILKRRTLAEILVLNLSKATAPHTPPDEPKEMELLKPSADTSDERLMLLHTTSDTNLLEPSLAHAPPAPRNSLVPIDETQRTASFSRSALRSRLSHNSRNLDSPGPRERHISFNTFVTQCIAIQPPEEHAVEDDDSDAEWEPIETTSPNGKGSKKGGSRASSLSSARSSRRPNLSRTNSHASDLSERLTIAPIEPTILKVRDPWESEQEDEDPNVPQLVYLPPSDSALDVDSPAGTNGDSSGAQAQSTAESPVVAAAAPAGTGKSTAVLDYLGIGSGIGDEYESAVTMQVGKKSRQSSTTNSGGDVVHPTATHHSIKSQGSVNSKDNGSQPNGSSQSTTSTSTSIKSATGPIAVPSSPRKTSTHLSAEDLTASGVVNGRGRTLQRSPSASSLNDRPKSRSSSIEDQAGASPESSRASSSRASSSEAGLGIRGRGKGVTSAEENIKTIAVKDDDEELERSTSTPQPTATPPAPAKVNGSASSAAAGKHDSHDNTQHTGLVNKAVGTAKGLIGSLLGHSSSSSHHSSGQASTA